MNVPNPGFAWLPEGELDHRRAGRFGAAVRSGPSIFRALRVGRGTVEN